MSGLTRYGCVGAPVGGGGEVSFALRRCSPARFQTTERRCSAAETRAGCRGQRGHTGTRGAGIDGKPRRCWRCGAPGWPESWRGQGGGKAGTAGTVDRDESEITLSLLLPWPAPNRTDSVELARLRQHQAHRRGARWPPGGGPRKSGGPTPETDQSASFLRAPVFRGWGVERRPFGHRASNPQPPAPGASSRKSRVLPGVF